MRATLAGEARLELNGGALRGLALDALPSGFADSGGGRRAVRREHRA
jgi:hypothetical protein